MHLRPWMPEENKEIPSEIFVILNNIAFPFLFFFFGFFSLSLSLFSSSQSPRRFSLFRSVCRFVRHRSARTFERMERVHKGWGSIGGPFYCTIERFYGTDSNGQRIPRTFWRWTSDGKSVYKGFIRDGRHHEGCRTKRERREFRGGRERGRTKNRKLLNEFSSTLT